MSANMSLMPQTKYVHFWTASTSLMSKKQPFLNCLTTVCHAIVYQFFWFGSWSLPLYSSLCSCGQFYIQSIFNYLQACGTCVFVFYIYIYIYIHIYMCIYKHFSKLLHKSTNGIQISQIIRPARSGGAPPLWTISRVDPKKTILIKWVALKHTIES